MSCQFDVRAELSNDNSLFFTVNKQLGKPGEFRPVYKSECKKSKNKVFAWSSVFTDTDTLADAIPENEVMIHLFQFNPNGNHKKVGTFTTTFA